MAELDAHALPTESVLRALETSPHGLERAEARFFDKN